MRYATYSRSLKGLTLGLGKTLPGSWVTLSSASLSWLSPTRRLSIGVSDLMLPKSSRSAINSERTFHESSSSLTAVLACLGVRASETSPCSAALMLTILSLCLRYHCE
jgi:hypothetical protein